MLTKWISWKIKWVQMTQLVTSGTQKVTSLMMGGSSGSLRPLQLCDSEFQFPGVMYVCDVVHLRGQRYCLDGQVECTESSESSGSSL